MNIGTLVEVKMDYLKNISVKAIDYSPWGGLEGFLAATAGDATNADNLRKAVTWLNKAVLMTGNMTAQIPYTFYRNDNEIDPMWGGVKSPQTLMLKMAMSLCGGAAYARITRTGRALVSLQYYSPKTITPNFNNNGELVDFTRQYKAHRENISIEEMLYIWLPDDTVEIGAAQITPLANAMLPAGMLGAMDATIKTYGENGFIKPMFAVAEGIQPEERKRAENVLSEFVRGTWKRLVKIVNAKSLVPQPVGAGMDELKGSYIEITRQQIETIAAAFGIPSGVFMSDNAFATEMDALVYIWLTSGVFVSVYQTIEDSFNQQIWEKFGVEARFDIQSLDAFQQEETDKSGSVATLSGVFTSEPDAALVAMDILGYELTDEQTAAIEALKPDKPEPPAEVAPVVEQPAPMTLPTDEENAIAEEMLKWRTFAERPRKREFETKHIPPALALRINAGLRAAKSADEIQAVFDGAVAELPVIALAAAIEKAAHAG